MNTLQKLTSLFADFPGIGPRQAKRFVYFLLTRNQSYLSELSELVAKIKEEIKTCESCFRFFFKNHSGSNVCDICSAPNRDRSILTVVSRDVDFENIEKTGVYNGKYFVLGGSVPILEPSPESKIRIKELMSTVESRASSVTSTDSSANLREIVLAVNANPEGENTGDYVKKMLAPLSLKHNLKISMLGRGLSTGTELEYSDAETLKNALKNRQ